MMYFSFCYQSVNKLKKKSKFSWLVFLAFLILPSIIYGSELDRFNEDPFTVKFSSKPEHVILYIIDGLSYKIWNRIELPVLKRMIENGVLVEENYLPPSAHPTDGEYAELHSCSIPNPVMMAGTLFITKDTIYLPQLFFPRETTVFVANTTTYRSLNQYYHYSFQKKCPDRQAAEIALKFFKLDRPAFLRLHLQDLGDTSVKIMETEEDVPWRGNIWAEGSPYLKMLKQADSLLGDFLHGLKQMGVLDKTVILVMGDHGEADTGYHPLEIIDASITSIVLWGAGIRKGVRIPYSEQMDVVPTICTLMSKEPPKGCQGRVIAEAISDFSSKVIPRKKLFKEMLEMFDSYRKKEAEASYILANLFSPQISRLYTDFDSLRQNFFDIQRFTEWPRFKTVEELLENNRRTLKYLEAFVNKIRKFY